MPGRQCYHCKSWIEEGEVHDCWTTTEAALTQDLSEDLRDAWERLRETAAEFGEQRIYASHKSIMFSRRSCYFFVRPRRSYLEVCVFLARPVNAPQVRRVEPASKSKLVHFLRIQHRDEVEAPMTDLLREAYELAGTRPAPAAARRSAPAPGRRSAATTARKAAGPAAGPAAGGPAATRGAAKKRPAARTPARTAGPTGRPSSPLTRRRSG